MTYRRRSDKRRRGRFPLDDPFGVRFVLSSGGPMGPFPWLEPDEHDLREAWEWIGAELVAEEIERAPGSRPWGWFAFEAPRALGADAPVYPPFSDDPEAEERALRLLLAHGVVDDAEQDAIVALAMSDDRTVLAERARQRAPIVIEHRRAQARLSERT